MINISPVRATSPDIRGKPVQPYVDRALSGRRTRNHSFDASHQGHANNAAELSMDWRNDAACLTEDPELFFPIGNTESAQRQIAQAKAVCDRCPAVNTCLTWALETGQDSGVCGALSEVERLAFKRREARRRRAR